LLGYIQQLSLTIMPIASVQSNEVRRTEAISRLADIKYNPVCKSASVCHSELACPPQADSVRAALSFSLMPRNILS